MASQIRQHEQEAVLARQQGDETLAKQHEQQANALRGELWEHEAVRHTIEVLAGHFMSHFGRLLRRFGDGEVPAPHTPHGESQAVRSLGGCMWLWFCEAVSRFDADRQARFTTFVETVLRCRMRDRLRTLRRRQRERNFDDNGGEDNE
jgi:hypothetical protein